MTKYDYLEGLSNHLLTFLPERRGIAGVDVTLRRLFRNEADHSTCSKQDCWTTFEAI
jgi:hypothetical protein